jgi:transposase
LAESLAPDWQKKKYPGRERLQDAQRCGGPPTFSLEQILQLFAIACEKPQGYGRALSHWTARELADEMVQQGIVKAISPRHLGRLLEEADFVTAPVAILVKSPPDVRENWIKWTAPITQQLCVRFVEALNHGESPYINASRVK